MVLFLSLWMWRHCALRRRALDHASWSLVAGAGMIAAELDGVIYFLHAPLLLCRLVALQPHRPLPPPPGLATAESQHHSGNPIPHNGMRKQAVQKCCVKQATQAMPQMHHVQLQGNPAAQQTWHASNPQLIGFRGRSAACMPYLAAPDECQASPI